MDKYLWKSKINRLLYWYQRMKIGTVPKEVQNYTIAEELGEGSFGKVFKGIDKRDQTQVALKFISKKGKNRRDLQGLRSENQMLKKVSHYNIIRLIDFVQTKNEMIIVTDYAGENLGELLKRHKKFSPEEVKNYSKQIFSALIYLSENKITHRDLKPANILIKDGIIKLCDFGFARKLSASTNFMNSLKGTPLYIAPEILDGRAYNHKVDIWSFGIIIYELFQGITPFHAETLHQLKPKILSQRVNFPKNMPIDMKTLIGGMLQKNPINRFDWSDLKKQPFFEDCILSEVNANNDGSFKKDKNSVQKPPPAEEMIMEEPQNLGINSNIVVHFLKGENDVEEIKKLEKDLLEGKLNPRELKTDGSLYDKIIIALKSFLKEEKIVTKDILLKIYSIITFLITKVKNSTPEQNQNDFTRKKELFLCILKLTDQETDPEHIEKLLVLIGFLMKLNFNSVSVDYDTDQEITDLCIREVKSPKSQKTFFNALKVLGILGNQGIITLSHSEDFFARVEEEKILSVIAEAYEPSPNKTIILQCLQTFIHPSIRAQIENNDHLRKIFKKLKSEVAIVQLNKSFLDVNPLTIFSDRALETWTKITYQCLNHSDLFRKQLLKQQYWLEMVKIKNLTSFWLAFDFICSSKEQTPLLPNQILKEYFDGGSSFMQKAFLLARAGLQLTKKLSSPAKTQHLQTLLITISETLCENQDVKIKASRSVEGFLCFGERIFEQAFAQTLCNIFTDREIKNQVDEGLLISILENLFKISQKMRVSPQTTAKIVIVLEEISKSEKISLRSNKKFLTIIFNIFTFYLNNGVFFQMVEENPTLTSQFLVSIFTLIKNYSLIDQKELFITYCRAEDKGIQNLLISNDMVNKKTLNITLSFLFKVSTDTKHHQSVLDFAGMSLLPKLKPFIASIVQDQEEGDLQIFIQIVQIVSLLMKKNEEYAGRIKQLEIIGKFNYFLMLPNDTVRHHVLMLIGHLAKHSQYFFDEFIKHGVFASIVESIRKYPQSASNPKIIKAVIYAIGNISFYTDRFQREITALIPLLSDTLANQNDPHTVTNTISTVSNLLRHSNLYLKALVQHNVIKKIIQIVLDTKKADNNMMFGLNAIKKALMYPEIFNDHPAEQFIKIYTEKKSIVGGQNQCMKKIRSLI